MHLLSGLLFGVLFGYFLKRSRFCATGITRDIVMEGRTYNFIYIPAIIFTEAFLYFGVVGSEAVPAPALAPFSLFRIALGSLMFGIGAVLCNGCIASSLIKCGDGRLIGWLSVAVFTVSAYTAKVGALKSITGQLNTIAVVPDTIVTQLPISPILLAAVAVFLLYIGLYRVYRHTQLRFTIPGRYTGLRHILFEKVWPKEITVILIGIIMALGFYFSNLAGRNGGFGITTPLISWLQFVGFGKSIGWASTFVVGIILGSFATTMLGGEFAVVRPKAKPVVLTVIGSILMGIGAVWASGCFVGNVMVGTSQFSMKAWYSLVFIYLGVWTATRLYLMRKRDKVQQI